MTVLLMNAIWIFARVLQYLVLARVLISWLPVGRDNIIIQLLYTLTEPILGPIRKLIYKSPLGGSGMVIDFSPVIAGVFIQLGAVLLIQLISSL